METFGFDKNIFNLRKENPNNISATGKRMDKTPKYLSKILFISINELPFLLKERRNKRPTKIREKEKIE